MLAPAQTSSQEICPQPEQRGMIWGQIRWWLLRIHLNGDDAVVGVNLIPDGADWFCLRSSRVRYYDQGLCYRPQRLEKKR